MCVEIGILIFPSVQQLDVTGPFEVFATEKRCNVHLIWKDLEVITSSNGLHLSPTATFSSCPPLSVLIIPGGRGINSLLEDHDTLQFIRSQASSVQYLCSVCTGAIVLGVAGLLKGKKAATHWMAMDMLPQFGAIPVQERVVWDGNIISAGGVTSGIDFALSILSHIFDTESAEMVQLYLEYAPAPPFSAGHPSTASAEIVERAREYGKASRAERERLVSEILSSQNGSNM
jgi:cyclohexyl-isocyanide hydratase